MKRQLAMVGLGGAIVIAAASFVTLRHLAEVPIVPPRAVQREIRGVVEDDAGPLAGATVRIQGLAASTRTDDRGRFELPLPAQRGLTLTASQPGYFIGGVPVDSPADSREPRIRLAPLPATDNDEYRWVDPTPHAHDAQRCGNCHRDIYDEWQSSGHATAATNRRFLNLFSGTDWHGRPDVGDNLRADHPNGTGVCAACHAPGLALSDPAVSDLRQTRSVDALGVHCDFCHKVQDVSIENVGLTHGRFGMQLLRPRGGQLFFGPLDDVNRGEDAFSPVQRESRYCASCHEGVVFGVHVYSTYSEWLASSAPRDGRTCQSCHMTPTGQMTNIAPDAGGLERDPRTLGSHSFLPGGRQAMLQRALDVRIRLDRDGEASVRIMAHDVGHRVPTGFIDRHLVLIVEAFDGEHRPLTAASESLLPVAAGTEFSGRAGRLFARLLADAGGHAPVPFWRAAGDPTDTRLRPGEPVTTTVRLPATAQSLRVRLLYRRFWPATAHEKSWPDDTLVVFDETQRVVGSRDCGDEPIE